MNYKNKSILITGGTGTIGNAILERLLTEKPRVIRMFSRDEHKQFELRHRLINQKNVRFLIGDVRDQERVCRAMKDIDIVFHAAALKHVPSCEFNPFEAVETNVKGTQNVVNAAIDNNVKKVIFVSTDKAAGGISVMGATKLLAERIVTAANHYKGKNKTIFSSIRLGNIAFSRGSVIPLFYSQMKTRKYINITEPRMTRFSLTAEEAANLIFEVADAMKGGEVFIPKMSAYILGTLADAIIEQEVDSLERWSEITRFIAGFAAPEYKKIIGMRPGERMHETIITAEEATNVIDTADFFIIPPTITSEEYESRKPTHKDTGFSYTSEYAPKLSMAQLTDILKRGKP